MNSHKFLSFVERNYDFARASEIFSKEELKNLWKPWLTTELACLVGDGLGESVDADMYYRGIAEEGEETFLRFQKKNGATVIKEKRYASKSDFSCEIEGDIHHFEVRCISISSLNKKGIAVLEEDIHRIETMKTLNKYNSITCVFAYFGSFDTSVIEKLKPLDNNIRCTYALDSRVTGSGCVSRLSHVNKSLPPRVILTAYSI